VILGFAPLPWEDTRCTYGPGIRAWQFALPLARDGHEVTLLCQRLPAAYGEGLPPTSEQERDGVRIVSMDAAVWNDSRTVAKLIEESRPEAIVAATIFASEPACELKDPPPLWIDLFGHVMAEAQAKAYRYQDDSFLAHFWRYERRAILYGDRFSAVSSAQRYATIGELGAVGRLNRLTTGYRFVHTIPCALEGEPYAPAEPWIRGNIVPEDAFVVLWSGGYNTWTDVDTLFAGLEAAMERVPELHFVSTGGEIAGHDERTYPRFQRLIAGSPHAERFHLLGWISRSRVPGTYFEANVGISIDTFMYEGMLGSKNRVLDWMRAGLPALVGELCELSRLLPREGIGYSFPLGDPAALAERIVALTQDPEAVAETGRRALEYGLEHFTFEKTTESLRAWIADPRPAPDRGTHPGRRAGLLGGIWAGFAPGDAAGAERAAAGAAPSGYQAEYLKLETYVHHLEDEIRRRDNVSLRRLLYLARRWLKVRLRRKIRGTAVPLTFLRPSVPAAIVIVAYKARELLRRCLLSLRELDYPSFEVIVVDNDSRDGTVAMIEEEFPEVRLLRNEENLGFAAACNQGIRASTAPLIVLLNQDTEVDPDWLSWISRGMSSDPLAGIAGCKIYYPDGETIQHAGGVLRANGLTNHIGDGEKDHGQYDEPREVDYVTGAAMALHREMLARIGLLDEGYRPAYYEELDLCVRARRKGYHVLYLPQARLRHHESTSTGKLSQRFLELYHRNRIRFVLKNYSLLRMLFGFLPAEVVWLLRHWPQEQREPLRRAYRENLRALPRILLSRYRRAPRLDAGGP
jgi:GT2 family glycosyltransferase/glycosyltransferase involved in cell wall biosynthesis